MSVTVYSTDAPDRRQRRWHQVHDRLYQAACELSLESGFVDTSVEQIAERADVARKTAFNHFPRKRDFILEWGKRRRQQVLAAVSPVLLADPSLEVVLRHYFAELAAINLAERALTIRMSLGWRESGGPFDDDPHELIGVFRGFISDAIARGEVSGIIDAERLGTVLYSSYFGLLYDWCDGPDAVPPFDLDVAFTQLLDIVLGGLRSVSDPRVHGAVVDRPPAAR